MAIISYGAIGSENFLSPLTVPRTVTENKVLRLHLWHVDLGRRKICLWCKMKDPDIDLGSFLEKYEFRQRGNLNNRQKSNVFLFTNYIPMRHVTVNPRFANTMRNIKLNYTRYSQLSSTVRLLHEVSANEGKGLFSKTYVIEIKNTDQGITVRSRDSYNWAAVECFLWDGGGVEGGGEPWSVGIAVDVYGKSLNGGPSSRAPIVTHLHLQLE